MRLKRLAAKRCRMRFARGGAAILRSAMPTATKRQESWVGGRRTASKRCAAISGTGRVKTRTGIAIKESIDGFLS